MSGERDVDVLDDLRAALSIEPSPGFEARVGAAVSGERRGARWQWVAGALAAGVAVAVAWTWQAGAVVPQARIDGPRAAVAPGVRSGASVRAVESGGPTSFAGPLREAGAPRRPAVDRPGSRRVVAVGPARARPLSLPAPVIVPKDQARQFALFVGAARRGEVPTGLAGTDVSQPLPPIAAIVVAPLDLPLLQDADAQGG